MTTRRKYIATVGTAAVAGCLGGTSSKSRIQFTTEEPLFEDESRWDDTPFTAAVFETPDDANEAINDDISYIDDIEHHLQFDPGETFLTVFASTLRLTEEGRNKGWCPRHSIDGDQVTFEIPLDEWPEPLEESANWVMVNVWSKSLFGNIPSRASVTVEFPPDDVQTCTD
ncbi:hypothetical protein IL252_12090 [Halomicrobium sp. IBSBa]|uniref:hypothetical protein n=1 Tax=Halomicrobium sp. IBSBa TaxID=2778916 RepID=UPI001ABF54CE|nr:hypothetical protein [Halomicrobium sp. IBSBa]MBO4248554.1 hypothetical protein [Halomicrobium sp. IBSBa]